MKVLLLFLEKNTTKKNIVFGIILIVLFNTFFLPKFPELFDNSNLSIEYILDLKFSYSSENAYDILSELGNDGRNIYKLLGFFVDTPYAIIYGFTYAFIIIILLDINKRSKLNYLALTPLLISFFDLLENTGIIIMITNYPKKLENISTLSSSFTSLKWIFAGITFLIIVGLLIINIFKNKKKTTF